MKTKFSGAILRPNTPASLAGFFISSFKESIMKKIYMLLLLSGAVSDFCHAGSSDRTAVDLEAGIISTNQLQVQEDDGETGIQTTSQVESKEDDVDAEESKSDISTCDHIFSMEAAVSFCTDIGKNVIAGVTTLYIGFVFGKYW